MCYFTDMKDEMQNPFACLHATAEMVGNYESNSPEWHALRATGVGGSVVGTILGLNPYESAFTAWAKRSGLITDQVPDNPAMEWGRRLEPMVLEKFQDEHPELNVWDSVGTWRNLDKPFMLANPDALAVTEDGEVQVVEIKTARFPDAWVDGPPPSYLAQVRWYLATLGLKKAHIAVLISGSDYREFQVEFNQFESDADIQAVERWLEHVESGQQPAWDGAESTYETVRRIHPEIENDSVELGDLAVELLAALEAEAAASATVVNLKTQVLDAMGFAKNGLLDGKVVFVRQARGAGAPFLMKKGK